MTCSAGGSECAAGESCAFDISAGGYICKCPGGAVRYSDQSCRQFDACSGPVDCDSAAICTNVFDAYTCRCPAGYTDVSIDPIRYPGRSCRRVENECASRSDNDCSPYANCYDAAQGYSCVCQQGFMDVSSVAGLPPGRRCTRESDECAHRSLHSCDDNARCVDLPDGYACQCAGGFVDVSVSANLPVGRVCTVSTNCPAQKTDLMFVIDGSGSIGAGIFANEVLRFVRQLVELFDVGLGSTRVGAYQYSNMIQREFYMNEFTTRNGVLNAISRINYLSGLTRTGLAMDAMVRKGFSTANGARPRSNDVARIAILITDGQSQQPQEIDPAARAALANGISVFAIGVTNHVDKEELVRITGGHSDRAFHVNDFTDLDIRLRSAIQKLACPVPKVPPGRGPCTPERHEGCQRQLNEVCAWDGRAFACGCPDGWTRNPRTNVCGGDICNPLISVSCEPNAHCAITPYRNHRCRCNPGIPWTQQGTCGSSNQGSCNPADPNACDPRRGTTCQRDQYGRYSCLCYPKQEDPATGICLTNECATRGQNDCHSHASCTDLVDGYHCQCLPDYRDVSPDPVNLPGRVCVERDLCRANRHNCSQDADCIRTGDGYTCACRTGFVDISPSRYVLPGRICQRKRNECQDGSHTCSKFATCQDTAESYRCICLTDYEDKDPLRNPGRHCVPIDKPPPPHPCDTGKHDCSGNADCLKASPTEYSCRCRYGFEDGADREPPTSASRGRVCEKPQPSTPPPGTIPCPDINNLCYRRRNERCVNNQCICLEGYQRTKGSNQCLEMEAVVLSARVIRDETVPLRWDAATFGSPSSAIHDVMVKKFDKGMEQSLDGGELAKFYGDVNTNFIADPSQLRADWDSGLIFNFTIHFVKGVANQRSTWRILSQYWRGNDWELGQSGLYLDPFYDPFSPRGVPCGASQCRESRGEVCDRDHFECVCDQSAARPQENIIFGRKSRNEACREMQGFTYVVNVLKNHAEETNYNSSFANADSAIWRHFADRFTFGMGQTYNDLGTSLAPNHVRTEVNGYRNPNVINANWERGVVFNYTSYFDKNAAVDPKDLYDQVIGHILRRNGKRIGTTGLTIADDQVNTYGPCYTHTCDPRARCIETPQGLNRYRCECPDGFKDADPDRAGGTCARIIDYCYDIDYCPGNTTCVNYADRGSCECLEGYESIQNMPEGLRIEKNLVGVGCLLRRDIRYCEWNLHDCSWLGVCTPSLADPGFTCACADGYQDQFPDTNPGRFCTGVLRSCPDCNGVGDCIAARGSRNFTCACYEGYDGDYCEIAIASVTWGAGLIIATILAILFLLLALCCLGYFCYQSKCCGLCATKAPASFSSADYGYGQMTIPRARLREGSLYDDASDASSDYTVVERRIVTEEKKLTNIPATGSSAFLVYPPGTDLNSVQMAQLSSGTSVSKAAITDHRFSQESSHLTQDRDMEEYTVSGSPQPNPLTNPIPATRPHLTRQDRRSYPSLGKTDTTLHP